MRCARYSANVVSHTIETGDMVWVRGYSVIVEGDDYCWRGGGGEDPEEDRGNRGCRPVGCHAILEFSRFDGISVRLGWGILTNGREGRGVKRTYAQLSSRRNQPLYRVGGKTEPTPSSEFRPSHLHRLPIPFHPFVSSHQLYIYTRRWQAKREGYRPLERQMTWTVLFNSGFVSASSVGEKNMASSSGCAIRSAIL